MKSKMPGGRRILSRIQTPNCPPSFPTKSVHIPGGMNHGDDKEPYVIPVASMIVFPKHVHLPEIPNQGNLYFDVMLFMFGLLVMMLQYTNLYKTVWWLPHSHSIIALNFYLIDTNLVLFVAVLMSRRTVAGFLQGTIDWKLKGILHWIIQGFKLVVLITFFGFLWYTGYFIFMKYSAMYCLFLGYPIATYLILFGPSLKPIYHRHSAWPKCTSSLNYQAHKPRTYSPEKDPMVFHNCTISPDLVREEVEALKTDFNCRVKQILFNSTMTAYYMAFIPLIFVQSTLYYDTWWTSQHIFLTWVSAFFMLICYFLPPSYLDLLHKCALHLGRWQKVEGRHAHVPYNAWSELQVWHKGALVKHVRGLFKADGINVTAEPANHLHSRFYFMFSKPLRVINWLLILKWIVVGYQFVCLLQCTEWVHILSLALLLSFNLFTLFKLMRDRFIMAKCYREEEYIKS